MSHNQFCVKELRILRNSSTSGRRMVFCLICNSNIFKILNFRSKRAAYKYSKNRGAVASRWCWLATQISDLDYKIRQHTDLRKHLRESKGEVQFEDVAGFEGLLPGSDAVDESSAARIRPYVKSTFRKRKLVQTTNLHQTSKKAGRTR